MKILFATSECVPFVKSGGLADVVGALSKSISRLGHEAHVVMPLYGQIGFRDEMKLYREFTVNLGWREQYAGIWTLDMGGVTFYFVDNEYYFKRGYLYGYGNEEAERFAFFSKAVIAMLPELMPDVVHANDWQTGMIPVLLRMQTQPVSDIRTLFTIHNLRFTGTFPIDSIEDFLSLGYHMYTGSKLELHGGCSFLKGGLNFSDEITTVSPTYAQEIQTPYYGEYLDSLMRYRADSLTGVLNGIDTEFYNPATDTELKAVYSADKPEGKAVNKRALQEELGLDVRPDIPLIAMVTRLSHQKGLDLVNAVIGDIMNEDLQFVVLGEGEDKYVEMCKWAGWAYKGRFASRIEMNEGLAHRVYAGSDLFLMPSLFEPCGLSQMIAMRYGSLPLVRETGGLRDTVMPYNQFTNEGNGFTFYPINAHDMLYTIRLALSIYHEKPESWRMMVGRAMRGEYGWDSSAEKYLDIYKRLLEKAPRIL